MGSKPTTPHKDDGLTFWSGEINLAGRHGCGEVYVKKTGQMRRGKYNSNKPVGKWLIFDQTGKFLAEEIYDGYGNLKSSTWNPATAENEAVIEPKKSKKSKKLVEESSD